MSTKLRKLFVGSCTVAYKPTSLPKRLHAYGRCFRSSACVVVVIVVVHLSRYDFRDRWLTVCEYVSANRGRRLIEGNADYLWCIPTDIMRLQVRSYACCGLRLGESFTGLYRLWCWGKAACTQPSLTNHQPTPAPRLPP